MPQNQTELLRLCQQLAQALLTAGWKVTTIESCTGGALSAHFTELAGSSSWFDCGFVTYSNAAKHRMVGVSNTTLQQYGAVSTQVASEMAKGGLENSDAQLAISITGIAGPGGGSASKPVGTVCFGIADAKQCVATTLHFEGNRQQVREQSMVYAVRELIHWI